MIRKNSRRLAKGAPQVSQSVTPAKSPAPAANPARTPITAPAFRVRQPVHAARGSRTTPSLHLTANAAPASTPAMRADPTFARSAARNAARRRAVEIGRGKEVAPYARGSQWNAYRNAAVEAVAACQPRRRAKAATRRIVRLEAAAEGMAALQERTCGSRAPATQASFMTGKTNTSGSKRHRRDQGS